MLMIPSSVVSTETDWGRQEKLLATFRILSHDNAESWKRSFYATSTRSGRSLDRLTRRRSVSRTPPQEQQEQERRKQILDQIMTVEARLRLSNIGASRTSTGAWWWGVL